MNPNECVDFKKNIIIALNGLTLLVFQALQIGLFPTQMYES
jgi:hypothetical protein